MKLGNALRPWKALCQVMHLPRAGGAGVERGGRDALGWRRCRALVAGAVLAAALGTGGCTSIGAGGEAQRWRESTRLAPAGAVVQRTDQASHAALGERLALRLLDHEALYTVAGIKPLSTGFWSASLATGPASGEGAQGPSRTAELERVRAALAPLSGWPFYADVQTFATERDGRRHLEAYVIHIPRLREALARHDVFARHGLTPTTHPAEVLAVVERMPRLDRFEAYGHLFGYPEHAVRFFVDAARAEASQAPAGEGSGASPRDFLHVPTFASATNRFVYAVPKGHEPNEADLALRARSAPVLEAYRAMRRARLGEAPTPPREPRDSDQASQANPVSEASGAADAPAKPAPTPKGAVRLFWDFAREQEGATRSR